MAAPIYNPIIPCVHPIPGGLYPGRMVRVQGNVPPGAQRFAINFQCGPNTDPRDDIALHLNFRFVEMCVVRNNLTSMNWGMEETSGGMPLNRGEGFEALILCEPQSIKVALNGVHFCEFPHRVPFQRISHLTVDGDVHIQFIGFEGAQPPQQMGGYMVQRYNRPTNYTIYRNNEPPAYGAYGAPPPAYGGQAYGAPQGFAPPGGQMPMQMMHQPQSRGLGAGAATGLGVGALAAGGLAGYALAGGFSSDSPTDQGAVYNPENASGMPISTDADFTPPEAGDEIENPQQDVKNDDYLGSEDKDDYLENEAGDGNEANEQEPAENDERNDGVDDNEIPQNDDEEAPEVVEEDDADDGNMDSDWLE